MARGDPIVVRLQVNWWMRRPLVSDQNWGGPNGRYRNTQSVSRRSFHSGGRFRVLHRPRSRRARGGRPRSCASWLGGGGGGPNWGGEMGAAFFLRPPLLPAQPPVL